jgi:hypothetical protein
MISALATMPGAIATRLSDGTFPQRLTKVDELTRQDHYWLEPDDECLFLGEYTARKGYAPGLCPSSSRYGDGQSAASVSS